MTWTFRWKGNMWLSTQLRIWPHKKHHIHHFFRCSLTSLTFFSVYMHISSHVSSGWKAFFKLYTIQLSVSGYRIICYTSKTRCIIFYSLCKLACWNNRLGFMEGWKYPVCQPRQKVWWLFKLLRYIRDKNSTTNNS